MSGGPGTTAADRSRCLLCGAAGRPWVVREDRELRRCGTCRFAWIVQGVKRTADGHSIYEGDTPVFLDAAQADYYRDDTALEAARAKLAWVSRFVPDGARLLDVGANLGLFVREASRRYDAIGIEPSPAAVELARREHGARLHAASIEETVLPDPGPFDAITLFDVLEHLADPERAIDRCRALLRPGGRLFLTTPDTGSALALVLGRHWPYIDMEEHVSLFNRRNLTDLLRQTGLEPIEVRTIGRSYRLSYIRRRLAVLGRSAPLLRLAHVLSAPLALAGSATLRLNFGDVVGVVARRR